jgi:hypothetical protein
MLTAPTATHEIIPNSSKESDAKTAAASTLNAEEESKKKLNIDLGHNVRIHI